MSIHVILVDDEQDVEFIFQVHLRKWIKSNNIQFEFALSGNVALDILDSIKDDEPVIILSDINMPDMDGMELTRTVRSKHPDIPIFIVSAYNDQKHIDDALSNGVTEYFTKPVDFDGLKKSLIQVFPNLSVAC